MLTGIASLARNLPGIRRVLSQHITKYNPINMGEEAKAMKFDKKYDFLQTTDAPSSKNIYRGVSLIDDTSKMSSAKPMRQLNKGEVFFTEDPIEASHFGYASQSNKNPAVILRMPADEANIRTTGNIMTREGGRHKIVSNPTQARIPVLMNLIIRLKKMGFKDAGIMNYLKQIYGSNYPKQFFKSGGIASLVL